MVDLDKLAAVAAGDGEAQVRVTKRWLKEAWRELNEGRSLDFDRNIPPLDVSDCVVIGVDLSSADDFTATAVS